MEALRTPCLAFLSFLIFFLNLIHPLLQLESHLFQKAFPGDFGPQFSALELLAFVWPTLGLPTHLLPRTLILPCLLCASGQHGRLTP